MRIVTIVVLASMLVSCYREAPRLPLPSPPSLLPEAPTGFDNLTNGSTDQATMDAARDQFVEDAGDELGPFFNNKACADCHMNPVIGGNSQVTEHRIAPDDPDDNIAPATLIHDGAVPGFAQQVAPRDATQALRSSLGLMGDAFVEAVPDSELIAIAHANGGQVIRVPVLESPGVMRVGRFGHKDQHASLLSFAMDADCNEKGVENRGVNGQHCDGKAPSNGIEDQQSGSTVGCSDPNCEDVDFYATFMRSLKAPPRGSITAAVTSGQKVFESLGCAICHVETLYTEGLKPKDVQFHPFGDFLLHDVGTGDGIPQGLAPANKVRTAPLWALRTKSRFLHDNRAFNIGDAIRAHRGEARNPGTLFRKLSKQDRANLLAFLNSL